MALGPEIARNPPSTWEETYKKQQKAIALKHLKAIAKAAEEELDARISTGRSLHAGWNAIGSAYHKSSPGLSYESCISAAYDVVNYALEELLEILRSRYLPSGWKNVLAGRDQGGSIYIYLVM